MATRGLRNFIRSQRKFNGQGTWQLKSLNGEAIFAFDTFCEKNLEYSFRTQKRYAEVAARFIDYLHEAGGLSGNISARKLNTIIEAYPVLLRDGSRLLAARIRSSDTDADLWLAQAAEKLDWAPLSRKSFSNTLAAVNRFLKLSEALAREANEKASLDEPTQNFTPLISVVTGMQTMTGPAVAAMRMNSMFGSVAKFSPKGVERPAGLKANGKHGRSPRQFLHFPIQHFGPLINAARNWRDRCFWLLLGAVGLRASEALNLRLEAIDFEHQRIYVFDPTDRRSAAEIHDSNRSRFKGRTMANTFPIPELKRDLFQAFEQYLRLEYLPCYRPGEAMYFLQYVDHARRGQPFVDASHTALMKSFSKAVTCVNVPLDTSQRSWSLHSLRHMYGMYIVNDLDVSPSEAQMMMGHSSIQSTLHYARASLQRLEAKLAASDHCILDPAPEVHVARPTTPILDLGLSR